MNATDKHSDLIAEWQVLEGDFSAAIPHAKRITKDHGMAFRLDCTLQNTGRLFYETQSKVELPFRLRNELKKRPRYSSEYGPTKAKKQEAFREYWFLVLGQFNRHSPKFFGYTTLEQHQHGHCNWAELNEDHEEAERCFLETPKKVKEVCQASQLVCTMMIRLLRKKPKQVSENKQPKRVGEKKKKDTLECPKCHNYDRLIRPVDLAELYKVKRQNIGFHMKKGNIPRIIAKKWECDEKIYLNQSLTCEFCWLAYRGALESQRKSKPKNDE